MMRFAAPLFAVAFVAAGTTVNAQTSVDARTSAIVSSFNKTKHVVKSKYGVTRDKYKSIQSEPAILSNRASYSGTYTVNGLGFSLELRVDHDGRVEGNGEEPLSTNPAVSRRFTLSGIVQGALLSATKTYANGTREELEGVFINSTSHESVSDPGTTMFGLGVISGLRDIGGVTTDKLFYQAGK